MKSWNVQRLIPFEIVARQAEAILADEAPEVLEAALQVLKPLQENFPGATHDEKEHSFTECACFADNIKDTGGMWQFNWHFHDGAFLDEGGSLDDFDFKPPEMDVIHALPALTKILMGEELTKED